MNGFRVASRVARASQSFKPAFKPASMAQRAFLSNSVVRREPETVNEKHVHVTGYKDGERTQEDITVKNEPVSPPGEDVQAKATPLDLNVIPQLTPTLKKFTLPGRIAVITG